MTQDATQPRPDEPRIRLGVSSCLLGEQVRFDGGHKRNAFLLNALGAYVEWVPVCPEVEVGMGTPRESVRLVEAEGGPRMVGGKSGRDWTEPMRAFAAARLQQLADERLHGFVLMKNSPSCGVFRVRTYPAAGGQASRKGRGLFAEALIRSAPLLPVEESGRIEDPRIRENFIERIFTYQRLRELLDNDPAPRDLVRFHTIHKCTFLAHDPQRYRKLGRLVAQAGATESGATGSGATGRSDPADFTALCDTYAALVMETLSVLATVGRHTNVLEHLAGHVSDSLDAADRAELTGLIADYRRGMVPLVVPVTLLRHHLRRCGTTWALDQVYLSPYPKELLLRNRV